MISNQNMMTRTFDPISMNLILKSKQVIEPFRMLQTNNARQTTQTLFYWILGVLWICVCECVSRGSGGWCGLASMSTEFVHNASRGLRTLISVLKSIFGARVYYFSMLMCVHMPLNANYIQILRAQNPEQGWGVNSGFYGLRNTFHLILEFRIICILNGEKIQPTLKLFWKIHMGTPSFTNAHVYLPK